MSLGDRIEFVGGSYEVRGLVDGRYVVRIRNRQKNHEAYRVWTEQDRVELAAGLEAVDAVTLFDEDTPTELIAAVLPDILVKGADWAHWIAGREEVEAAGGKVMALPLEPGYSTSGIVEEILSRSS